jgi:hypothetical protein
MAQDIGSCFLQRCFLRIASPLASALPGDHLLEPADVQRRPSGGREAVQVRNFVAVERSVPRRARTALLACAGTLLLVSACGSAVARTASTATHGTAGRSPDSTATGATPRSSNAVSSQIGRSYAAPPIRCGQGEQPIGYLGVVRPGQATAARNMLGAALLAEVSDASLGLIDIAMTANGTSAARRQRDFSSWGPVLPQARQARLQSCSMLLSDRPADQPLITAALAAAARHGYVTPAARLKSKLLEVLVSDNPAANGSVIVTLQADGGPGYKMSASGGPPVSGYLVYTVLENVSNAQVTGVAAGGFGAEVPFMVKCRIGPAPPASVAGPAAAAIDAVKECR